MRGVLQTSGVAIVSGLLGSLLAAAPLTRLHKATSLLVDVVVLLTRLMGGNADAAASLAKEWLQAALANLPPGMLLPGKAHCSHTHNHFSQCLLKLIRLPSRPN
jgi:hypothetical protein